MLGKGSSPQIQGIFSSGGFDRVFFLCGFLSRGNCGRDFVGRLLSGGSSLGILYGVFFGFFFHLEASCSVYVIISSYFPLQRPNAHYIHLYIQRMQTACL